MVNSNTTTTTTILLKRGNYSLLRLLTIVNSVGDEGITNRKLMDQIGTHANYLKEKIDLAKDLELITKREKEGDTTGYEYNYITEKGRQLLKSQFLSH